MVNNLMTQKSVDIIKMFNIIKRTYITIIFIRNYFLGVRKFHILQIKRDYYRKHTIFLTGEKI